jgi:hypothetical protein
MIVDWILSGSSRVHILPLSRLGVLELFNASANYQARSAHTATYRLYPVPGHSHS